MRSFALAVEEENRARVGLEDERDLAEELAQQVLAGDVAERRLRDALELPQRLRDALGLRSCLLLPLEQPLSLFDEESQAVIRLHTLGDIPEEVDGIDHLAGVVQHR